MQTRPLFEINNPAGIWRCTRSTFDDFVVGCEYPCLTEDNGSHRIYPRLHQQAWSPYWEAHRARFCYRTDELDFVFVRPFAPSEEGKLIYQRDSTPAPTYPHISFPLSFVEDKPAPAPKRRLTLPRPTRNQIRDASIFLAGAAVTALACLSL